MNILKKITKAYIKQNRRRTIFTMLGIILTSVMITSVILLAGSFQDFMINLKKAQYGDWQLNFSNIKYEKKDIINDNLDIKNKIIKIMKVMKIKKIKF